MRYIGLFAIPARFAPLFSAIMVVVTLVACAIRVQAALDGAGLGDDWSTTIWLIFDALPSAGIAGFILALFVVTAVEMLTKLFSRKKNEDSSEQE